MSEFEKAPLYVFAAIGLAVVGLCLLVILIKLCKFIYVHYTPPGVNFPSLGKYAVITGGTDGIGKEYAFELARYGMDIVLISRTMQKLENVAAEIKTAYPDRDVKVIQADFTKTDIYDGIEVELNKIDIGVLVNNVGMVTTGMRRIHRFPRSEIADTLTCNIDSVVFMSHIVLAKMAEKKRGVVINISSIMASFPPMYALYATSKAFVSQFSHATHLQYTQRGIICLNVEPGLVHTKLAQYIEGIDVVSPEICAVHSLKTVGKCRSTYGSVRHEILGNLLSCLPFRLQLLYFFPAVQRMRKVVKENRQV